MVKPQTDNRMFEESVDLILSECRQALGRVDPAAVEELVAAILGAEKVFFIGVGRVMLALMAMAKRLSHLGIHTCIVGEITEPAITNRDLLIIGSGSGESLIPVAIGKKAKSFGARIVHIGSNSESSLKPLTDIFIRVPVRTKLARPDEIDSHQPMTSLFEQSLLLFGDALAGIIIRRRNLDLKSLWQFHANLE
jgi:6-phospho-3-hexuloisomerase